MTSKFSKPAYAAHTHTTIYTYAHAYLCIKYGAHSRTAIYTMCIKLPRGPETMPIQLTHIHTHTCASSCHCALKACICSSYTHTHTHTCASSCHGALKACICSSYTHTHTHMCIKLPLCPQSMHMQLIHTHTHTHTYLCIKLSLCPQSLPMQLICRILRLSKRHSCNIAHTYTHTRICTHTHTLIHSHTPVHQAATVPSKPAYAAHLPHIAAVQTSLQEHRPCPPESAVCVVCMGTWETLRRQHFAPL